MECATPTSCCTAVEEVKSNAFQAMSMPLPDLPPALVEQLEQIHDKIQRSLAKKKRMFFSASKFQRMFAKQKRMLLGLGKSASNPTDESAHRVDPVDLRIGDAHDEIDAEVAGDAGVDNLPTLLQDEFEAMGINVEDAEALYVSIKYTVDDDIKNQMIEYISQEGPGKATLHEFWDVCINGGCDAAGRLNPFVSKSTTPLQELWKAAFSVAWLSACTILGDVSCVVDVGARLNSTICMASKLDECSVEDDFDSISFDACRAGGA